MITFAKLDSTLINSLGKRIIKILEFGTKTASESMPFGIDSTPIKGMTAIHSQSSNNAESVIIGYINTKQLSEYGESRMYSVDENNTLKAFIWNKKDGKLWLNGNSYSSIRFEPLQSALNTQTNLINAELLKIQTAISILGGAYAKTDVVINIDSSKSEDVKLK